MAFLVVVGVTGCTEPAGEVVSVAAASSLRDVLQAAAPDFAAAHPEVELELSFEASSTIARQLAAGAGFDVFLSADPPSVERVLARLDADSRRGFLSNRLVLVAAAGRGGDVRAPADLSGVLGSIAVPNPLVPAGRYARFLLDDRGLLDELEPRFVGARNVRAALALVLSGVTEFGFVYLSDYRRAPELELLWTGPVGDPPIAYVGAATRGAGSSAGAFLEWLAGDAFQEAAEAHGFTRYRP